MKEINLYTRPVGRMDAGTFMVVESEGEIPLEGKKRKFKNPTVIFAGRHSLADKWIGFGIARSIAYKGRKVGIILREGDEVRFPVRR